MEWGGWQERAESGRTGHVLHLLHTTSKLESLLTLHLGAATSQHHMQSESKVSAGEHKRTKTQPRDPPPVLTHVVSDPRPSPREFRKPLGNPW